MKKILSLLILGIFLISFVSAFSICVDKTPPSSPSNLAVIGEVGNIVLTWDEATDEPSCSGIDYYNISRDGNWIGQVSGDILSFVDGDELDVGNYTYTIYAVDKVGHNKGISINNDVVLSKPDDDNGAVVVNGGGGGSSYHDDDDDTQTFTPLTTDTSQDNGETDGIILEEPSETNFFSRMTGAVVGGVTNFAKTEPGSMILIVLIVWLTFFIAVRTYRLKKKSKSTSSSTPEPISQTETTEPETQ